VTSDVEMSEVRDLIRRVTGAGEGGRSCVFILIDGDKQRMGVVGMTIGGLVDALSKALAQVLTEPPGRMGELKPLDPPG
jgi:hypothetical protein